MPSSATWPRVIVHADMDAFYAAVEQLDDPALRGRPILVGPPGTRGVVLTASYEARPFRVGSAMPMALARRRCPEAIVVPPRFDRYREISRLVMQTFADFSPAVEPLSLDEAFLDMSGAEGLFGPPAAIGRRLRDAVRETTQGLTVSVGISGTKYIAKVASGHTKPDGLTIVPPAEAAAWLAPQSVAVLWGAGPKMQARLGALGIRTVGELAAWGEDRLEAAIGQAGRHFSALARGLDPRPVESDRQARGLSSERTLTRDVSDPAEIRHHLRQAAAIVARRLRQAGQTAQGVRIKLKTSDFRLLSRQRRLRDASSASEAIEQAARSLLSEIDDPGPFRLIGVGVFDIGTAEAGGQLGLLDSGRSGDRLDQVLDALQQKFGPRSVQRAADLIDRTVFSDDVNLDYLRAGAAPGEDSED